MKRIFILPLIILLVFNISCASGATKTVNASPQKTSNILVVGLDDAAQNMDVLCFVSYSEELNEISYVQLPRDTYFDFGGTQNKINQCYSFYRATLEPKAAIKRATSEIASALAVPLDGYIAITTTGLMNSIDALGGIDIEMTDAAVFTDELGENPLSLNKGNNHLNGEECVQFLRYRKGYLTGDLGRLDAQKLFFRAVLKKFSDKLPTDKLIYAFLSVQNDIMTDMNVLDFIRMSRGRMDALSDVNVNYLTMPGEAAISSRGLSYYVLNKRSAKEICERYLFSKGASFDLAGKFLNRNEISFSNIYNDQNNKYRVYDNNSLEGIHIPKKSKD